MPAPAAVVPGRLAVAPGPAKTNHLCPSLKLNHIHILQINICTTTPESKILYQNNCNLSIAISNIGALIITNAHANADK
jgi:hypothetical protein